MANNSKNTRITNSASRSMEERMATESRKHETSDKLTVQSLAWAVWQVLGWDWGLNPGKEKSRICNWFWDVSRGEDRPLSELFPLGSAETGGEKTSDKKEKM